MTVRNGVIRDVSDEKVRVALIECERGWGSKVDEVREFDTMELAKEFIIEFNSVNTDTVTPDWYMYAELA